LAAVIDGSRADSSHGPFGSHTNRDRAGSYLMFAAEQSSTPPAPALNPSTTKSVPQAGAGKPLPSAGIAAGTPAPSPAKAPSLIQRLEGREGDVMTWLAIAAVFFLVGWIGGGIHARRRERSRRTRLRF